VIKYSVIIFEGTLTKSGATVSTVYTSPDFYDLLASADQVTFQLVADSWSGSFANNGLVVDLTVMHGPDGLAWDNANLPGSSTPIKLSITNVSQLQTTAATLSLASGATYGSTVVTLGAKVRASLQIDSTANDGVATVRLIACGRTI